MTGLLDILDLKDKEIDISYIGSSEFNSERAIATIFEIIKKWDTFTIYKDIKNKAQRIAFNCFNEMLEQMK
jgi:hypothetical protein